MFFFHLFKLKKAGCLFENRVSAPGISQGPMQKLYSLVHTCNANANPRKGRSLVERKFKEVKIRRRSEGPPKLFPRWRTRVNLSPKLVYPPWFWYTPCLRDENKTYLYSVQQKMYTYNTVNRIISKI